MAERVVVVGGGFAGVLAVRGLRGADVDVTLIDRQNFYLFQPLAYQVATGSPSPGAGAVPPPRTPPPRRGRPRSRPARSRRTRSRSRCGRSLAVSATRA